MPTPRSAKCRISSIIAALKVQADLSFAQFISNTSYFHRQEQTGYEGTLYNLGFYQVYAFPGNTLLDGTGVHLPAGVTDYRSPSSDRQPSGEHHPGTAAAVERSGLAAAVDRWRVPEREPPELS